VIASFLPAETTHPPDTSVRRLDSKTDPAKHWMRGLFKVTANTNRSKRRADKRSKKKTKREKSKDPRHLALLQNIPILDSRIHGDQQRGAPAFRKTKRPIFSLVFKIA
jgi:hypothetical protein